MEIFYELVMKNGFCFLVGTNKEGICEFSINENEFVIYTETDGNGEFVDFSFSVDTGFDFDLSRKGYSMQEDFSVLSVRKVDERQNKIKREINRKAEESIKAASFRKWKPSSINKVLRFCAHRGCIITPNGWIHA